MCLISAYGPPTTVTGLSICSSSYLYGAVSLATSCTLAGTGLLWMLGAYISRRGRVKLEDKPSKLETELLNAPTDLNKVERNTEDYFANGSNLDDKV